MNWMEVSKAIDELKRHMLTKDLKEWLQRGHEILYEKEMKE